MRRARRRAPSRTSSVARLVGMVGSPRVVVVACDPTSRGVAVPHPDPRPGAGRRLRPAGRGGGGGVDLGTAHPRGRRPDARHRVLAQRPQPARARRCGCSPVARERAGWRARSARDRRLSRLSGAFLAAHFATWIPSLSFTTVASSVALVATQPVWAALIARQRGEHIHRQTWIGIGLALAGTLVLTGVDLSISGRALFGDLLALVGGMLAAAYVTVGGEVRQRRVDGVVRAGLLRHRVGAAPRRSAS